MLVADGNGVPTPKKKQGGFQVPSYAEYKAQARLVAGAEKINPAIVPLWVNRPSLPKTGGLSAQGAAKAADMFGQQTPPSSAEFATQNPDLATGYTTVDDAKVAFLDLPQAQIDEFRHKAIQAGLVKPDVTLAELYSLWQSMVSDAADYNGTRKDSKHWLSPFEALDKLSMQRASWGNKSADDLSGVKTQTDTSVQEFNTSTLASTAQQVLQQELGRDPTANELKAYTLAVNKAAEANPVTTVTKGTYNKAGDLVSRSSRQSGGVDATDVIRSDVEDDPEATAYQSAATYYPAAMAALDAAVSL